MSKPKLVPIEKEREFIKLDTQMQILARKHKAVKLELLKYHQNGYEFSLIRPSDTSSGVFSPPWKKIALQLIQKFFTSKVARAAYMRSIRKTYPPKERAPKFTVPGKKVLSEV